MNRGYTVNTVATLARLFSQYGKEKHTRSCSVEHATRLFFSPLTFGSKCTEPEFSHFVCKCLGPTASTHNANQFVLQPFCTQRQSSYTIGKLFPECLFSVCTWPLLWKQPATAGHLILRSLGFRRQSEKTRKDPHHYVSGFFLSVCLWSCHY